MNERIRELLVKAGVINNNFNPLAYEQWYLDSLEKFAELIVRECMTICKEHPSRILSNNWNADAVAPDIVHRFEEHFGVEE
jgi:hypothetical protein